MPDSPRGHVVLWVAQMYRAWLWALLTPAIFMLRQELNRRHPNMAL
jgi:hypothetical protein